jgi:hypothetical protein
MRGYDVDEVRKFLDEVSKEFDMLVRDEISVEDELEATKKRLEHYLGLESTLEKTLLAAQQTAIKMEEQAKKEAELICTPRVSNTRRIANENRYTFCCSVFCFISGFRASNAGSNDRPRWPSPSYDRSRLGPSDSGF